MVGNFLTKDENKVWISIMKCRTSLMSKTCLFLFFNKLKINFNIN